MTGIARSSVRVTIIDDHALFAESLAITLEAEGYPVRRIDLAAAHASLATVLSSIRRSVPRVVLLDLDLGHIGDGTRLIDPLAALGSAVIVVTGSSDRVRWGDCLRRGAKTVLMKTSPLNLVVSTVRRAGEGLPLMEREERQRLVELAVRDLAETREIKARFERLTRREAEILGALMRGEQVRDVARLCVVSEATVRTQVKSILAKLEMNSQIAAVGAAHRVGWRPSSD